MKRVLFITLFISILMSCTDNDIVKNFGGTTTIDLPNNIKLVNVTWKETNLWYTVRPMRIDEEAEVYTFQEQSSYGVIEGKYIIREHKEKQVSQIETEYISRDSAAFWPVDTFVIEN